MNLNSAVALAGLLTIACIGCSGGYNGQKWLSCNSLAARCDVSWWRFIMIGRWLQSPSPWWKHFPRTENRKCHPRPGPADRQELQPGDVVRLKLKSELPRRVIRSEWHCHRYEFVYIIETSAQPPFEPYWFFDQLEIESSHLSSPQRLDGHV